MNLTESQEGEKYIINNINISDDELVAFLLSLGCYPGESITVISKKKRNLIVAIKDSRYSIDHLLAESIVVE